MRTRALAAAALLLSTTTLHAAGLDRSFQNTSWIFADDGTASFTFSHVNPDVTGTDAFGARYDVGESYEQTQFTYTHGLTEDVTIGVHVDQPFGADVFYNAAPAASTLGGTGADLSSEALTVLGKYQITPRISVFGGAKIQRVRASVDLNGVAYRNAIPTAGVVGAFNAVLPTGAPALSTALLGAALQGDVTAATTIDTTYGGGTTATLGGQVAGLQGAFDADNGYSFSMDADTQVGYLVGAAYEIPDIALRAALTYHAEIDHTASTQEQILGNAVGGTVDYVTPQSVNFDFQTGIAADTLLLFSYRWTDFSAVDVVPLGLGSDLVNLDDGHRYTLGVGRRFTDNFSGSVTDRKSVV